jgi:hypothetical protein
MLGDRLDLRIARGAHGTSVWQSAQAVASVGGPVRDEFAGRTDDADPLPRVRLLTRRQLTQSNEAP